VTERNTAPRDEATWVHGSDCREPTARNGAGLPWVRPRVVRIGTEATALAEGNGADNAAYS